jgi:hypothetical protein
LHRRGTIFTVVGDGLNVRLELLISLCWLGVQGEVQHLSSSTARAARVKVLLTRLGHVGGVSARVRHVLNQPAARVPGFATAFSGRRGPTIIFHASLCNVNGHLSTVITLPTSEGGGPSQTASPDKKVDDDYDEYDGYDVQKFHFRYALLTENS